MEEKKEVKVRLSTVVLLFIIVVLIVALGVVYYLGFVKNDNANNMIANGEVAEKNNTSVNEEKTETNSAEKNQTEKSIYEKYEGLYWMFDDENSSEIEFLNKKIVIENGIAYLEENDTREKINSIEGKVKSIAMWGAHTLERVYVLTEDGNVWVSFCSDTGEKSDGLNNIFEKINLDVAVINMTNGNSDIRIVEPPYFLLSNGKLVNEEGSLYEELDGNFVNSFGTVEGQVFIKADNTIYTYDYQTRKYIQIKDENNYSIKMKDAFIQWSTMHNDLEIGIERTFVITEDNKLLFFNGYSNVVAKEYKEATGKTIKDVVKEEQKDEYGGHRTNAKITFTDETEIILKDVHFIDK